MHLGQVAIEDHARGDQVAGRVTVTVDREIAAGQEVAHAFTAFEPVLVETGNGQCIRYIDLIHELLHLNDRVAHDAHAQVVHRGLAAAARSPAEGGRGAADDEVRVRVLATEDCVQLGHVALPGQGVQVMGDRHQVGFGRKPVLGVTPVGIREDPQLAGFHEVLHLRLDIGKVAGGGIAVLGDRLRQFRSCLRVRLQRGDDVHPIQCMQVIEVHHVIVDVLCPAHQVADQLGVLRDRIIEGILDRTDRGHAVHQGADAADALGEGPGVARVATLHHDLEPAHHGAGAVRARDAVLAIGFRLDAQVTFNTGDRVDNDSICAHFSASSTRLSATSSRRLFICLSQFSFSPLSSKF
jgi:hypothetical protein